jgi:hypothetical protein
VKAYRIEIYEGKDGTLQRDENGIVYPDIGG